MIRLSASAFVTSLAVLATSSASAFAQANPEDCNPSKYFQAWVDPYYGDDATGAFDDPSQPFRTINSAIASLITPVAGDMTKDGLVHALPGIYTEQGSAGIDFPIVMRPRIHVQGAGAKETVLRVRQDSGTRNVYWPLSTGLIRRSSTIAVDFTLQNGSGASMFDGFTIQGADVQVYAETEAGPRSGRVSNCVFDMRHEGYEELSGPYFGVLIAATYFGEGHIDYWDMPFYLFNNTFIQGTTYGGDSGQIDVAREESVAICNTNDPSPPCGFPICFEDPNLTIRGVTDLHVQNNLIRSLDDFPRTAMLGIDRSDTRVVVSSRTGAYDTNAFDAPLTGGFSVDPANTFFSDIDVGETSPVPVVDLVLPDPGFFGEWISDTTSPGVGMRDFRLIPDSVLVDEGASPAWRADACTAPFEAENGLLYVDTTRAQALSSFDFDGDVHGNPRIVGEDVDVGFDEVDLYAVTGSYGNDTKSHHLCFDPALAAATDQAGILLVQPGTPDREQVFATPQTFFFTSTMIDFLWPCTLWYPWIVPPEPRWTVTGSWTHMPGTIAFQTDLVAPSGPSLAPVMFWLDMQGLFTGTFIPASTPATYSTTPRTWINLESGATHSFHSYLWSLDETTFTLPPQYFSTQTFVIDPVLGILSSNVQCEFL